MSDRLWSIAPDRKAPQHRAWLAELLQKHLAARGTAFRPETCQRRHDACADSLYACDVITHTLSLAELADILAFYDAAGVDQAIEETPLNRLSEPAMRGQAAAPRAVGQPRAAPGVVAASPAPTPVAAPTPQQAQASAAEIAAGCDHLDALKAALEAFEGCALKKTATQLCFEDGVRGAPVMLVGEAPGADEDRLGRPFVGVSGQLLDRMLAEIGLSRESNVYIANVVPWRPPGNRTPTTQELAICRPFIARQIALARPRILVTLGGPAAQALLGVAGIMAQRGRWREYPTGSAPNESVIPALPTLHPAYLLRNPIAKRQAWADLRSLAKKLSGLN